MPIAAGKDLLTAAEHGGYAVPGFNVSNLELALGVIDAAEARRAPLLLQFNPSNIEHFGSLALAAATARSIAEQASVPVAIHLDHGPNVALLRAAVQVGFTSLMYDGSTYPFERNVRETREAYAVAAKAGVALEAELGRPVVTSNQAALWCALRTAGIADAIPGLGRLLQMDLARIPAQETAS